MATVLREAGDTVIATDLRQTGFGESNVDFITCQLRPADAVITNPPFEIADQSIRKALSAAPIVAMLLKSQYWHAQKRYQLYLQNPPAWVLPLTWRPDFLGGGAPTMDCAWTVWVRGNTTARYQPLPKGSASSQSEMILGNQTENFKESAA